MVNFMEIALNFMSSVIGLIISMTTITAIPTVTFTTIATTSSLLPSRPLSWARWDRRFSGCYSWTTLSASGSRQSC